MSMEYLIMNCFISLQGATAQGLIDVWFSVITALIGFVYFPLHFVGYGL